MRRSGGWDLVGRGRVGFLSLGGLNQLLHADHEGLSGLSHLLSLGGGGKGGESLDSLERK